MFAAVPKRNDPVQSLVPTDTKTGVVVPKIPPTSDLSAANAGAERSSNDKINASVTFAEAPVEPVGHQLAKVVEIMNFFPLLQFGNSVYVKSTA